MWQYIGLALSVAFLIYRTFYDPSFGKESIGMVKSILNVNNGPTLTATLSNCLLQANRKEFKKRFPKIYKEIIKKEEKKSEEEMAKDIKDLNLTPEQMSKARKIANRRK